MEDTLGYLRESLSNYSEDQTVVQRLYEKLNQNNYENEQDFVRDLEEVEMKFLNRILTAEIDYARNGNDEKRAQQLSEIYELLV